MQRGDESVSPAPHCQSLQNYHLQLSFATLTCSFYPTEYMSLELLIWLFSGLYLDGVEVEAKFSL